jgi:hypothetical protein
MGTEILFVTGAAMIVDAPYDMVEREVREHAWLRYLDAGLHEMVTIGTAHIVRLRAVEL